MKLIYKDGNVTFDLIGLVESISAEDKLSLVESLSCDDDVIDHVTNQLLEGWTVNMFHGKESYISDAEPRTGLDLARRRIAKECHAIAKEEIENLEKALAKAKIDYYDLLYKR